MKFLFSSHRQKDQTFNCTQLYCLNFRAQKSTLKSASLLYQWKNLSRFEWLTNQRAKDCFELIFWNLEWLLTLFTLLLLHKNVRDFKFQIEEQKKVHLHVDMTNISPPSEKNVPLTCMQFHSGIPAKLMQRLFFTWIVIFLFQFPSFFVSLNSFFKRILR